MRAKHSRSVVFGFAALVLVVASAFTPWFEWSVQNWPEAQVRVCEFNTCTPSKAVEGSSASWSTSVLLTRHCRVRVSVCLHHRSTARTLCRGVHSTYCSSG